LQLQEFYKNGKLGWKLQKKKCPQWTSRNKKTNLHNDSHLEGQSNIEQSNPWMQDEGMTMVLPKHNHAMTTIAPSKKVGTIYECT
jgi:hypothetical protein